MINVNEVTLIGTMDCEPVFDTMLGGASVCKFIVETIDEFKGSTRPSKHNISVIGTLCDIVALHGHKGTKVHIRGRLEYWSDQKNNRLVDVRATYARFDK